MKLMNLSLILCIIPHLTQASSESSSNPTPPSTQSFARIVTLASLTKEELIKRAQEDKNIIRGNLFIVGSTPIYAGTNTLAWRRIKNIVDAQDNPATINPRDVLVQLSAHDKGLICSVWDAAKGTNGIWNNSWNNHGHPCLGECFPENIPLDWIDKAQTGDILEFEYKNPKTDQAYSVQLECKDRDKNESFKDHLTRLKERFAKSPNYYFTDRDLLLKEGALEQIGQHQYKHGPNGFKLTPSAK